MKKKKFKQLLELLQTDRMATEQLKQLSTPRLSQYYKVIKDKVLFVSQVYLKEKEHLEQIKQILNEREQVDK